MDYLKQAKEQLAEAEKGGDPEEIASAASKVAALSAGKKKAGK